MFDMRPEAYLSGFFEGTVASVAWGGLEGRGFMLMGLPGTGGRGGVAGDLDLGDTGESLIL